MGQMAAVGQVHSHEGVPGLEQRHVDGHVRLGTAVGLDVRVLGAEELDGAPADGETFDDVDYLASTVVTPARDSLRRTCW